ncbi:MAG: hypothetical protein HYX69_19500 [Planctomycetia bacterium]|nr:hypothetical protein [Planctomycetia bacterium]
MEGAEPNDPIHHLVLEIMGQLAHCVPVAAEVAKSVLVREGEYCGRAFKFRDIRAVWFADANELKFYRDRGPLLRCVRLDGRTELCRAA